VEFIRQQISEDNVGVGVPLQHSQPQQPGKIKSRGFDKSLRRKMNGQTEKRT
jgi:hypothetical protein